MKRERREWGLVVDSRVNVTFDRMGRSRANKIRETRGTFARAEGKTVDELTSEALKRDIVRPRDQANPARGKAWREGLTDAQIEGVVNMAAQDWRRECRR